ncbi:beta-defensin 129 [Manis pentadactyla]|uniref:beta-defensin 129 n=1 Tax=Manis pentadactyla TaxID=143292 RepID=UPI00255CD73A|nr:beta-defensin 129 [Manis pentadactyla]KAI5248009.1 hypothetical protein MUG91_G194n26 [Manis pentadactyla]
MKLLFPIFAGLMLQHQVNTEYFGLRKCLKGLGKCKDYCAVHEKEVQKCKKKKCCIGPKLVQLIKNYIQNEMSHIFEEDSQELLKTTKYSRAEIQTKYHTTSLLPKMKSTSPFANINTPIIQNVTAVNSATTNPMISEKIKYTATSTKRDTKERRGSATDTPPPPAPPPQSPPTP